MDLVSRELRNNFLPFKLGSDIPTTWSFRTSDKAKGKISIMPTAHGLFPLDISYKQVFMKWKEDFNGVDIGGDIPITFNTILNNIPAIQIREYQQDTRLDMVLSLVDFFKQGYKDGSEIGKMLKGSEELKYFQEFITYDIQHIGQNTYWKSIFDAFKNIITEGVGDNFYGRMKDDKMRKCVIDFCYTMYYRLITTTSTNVYTLPYNSNHILKGNGFEGFEKGFDLGSSIKGGDNITGSLINFISPNLTLTTTPLWKGVRGGEGINIDLTLNLFNDTRERAVKNYIFVHTLMPQNLPTQYAVFQQAPSLYDLKIEGGNRLFMCAGNFECTYKGVMRNPNREFYDELFIYKNKDLDLKLIKDFRTNNLIRIPDIYEITMHFKSLLPNNFNNFIFQFALNSKMDKVKKDQPGTLEGDGANTITTVIGNWIKQRAEDVSSLKAEIDSKRNEIQNKIYFIQDQAIHGAYNRYSNLGSHSPVMDTSGLQKDLENVEVTIKQQFKERDNQ